MQKHNNNNNKENEKDEDGEISLNEAQVAFISALKTTRDKTSNKALAERLGTSPSYLSMVIAGRRLGLKHMYEWSKEIGYDIESKKIIDHGEGVVIDKLFFKILPTTRPLFEAINSALKYESLKMIKSSIEVLLDIVTKAEKNKPGENVKNEGGTESLD